MKKTIFEENDQLEEKGTKTIKISKDVYDSLLYVKGMDSNESMTKTINKLSLAFSYDCVPYSDLDETGSNWIFKVKSKSGRERLIPNFSNKYKIIRVKKEIYNDLNRNKSHPDETLNTVLFRLLCSFYQNKPIYRVFTTNCGNCGCLKEDLKRLKTKNPLIAENIFIEFVFNNENFKDVIYTHYKKQIEENGSYMMPLSILYDSEGKEVWYATGYHDCDKVKDKLELMAKEAQIKPDVAQLIQKPEKKKKATTNTKKQIESETQKQECIGACKISFPSKE